MSLPRNDRNFKSTALVGAPGADLRVELLDQAIPRRDAVHQPTPELLVVAAIEILDSHALLLHPGEISAIEDTFAIEMGELEDVIVDDALQVAAEDLAGVDFIEPVAIASREETLPLTRIKRGAIGGDRHDHVVATEIEMLGDLDCGDDVGEARDADIVESTRHFRIDLAPPSQITASDITPEQGIERIAGEIGHADHHVGVHHVVNKRNMLVADALDVMRPVSVAQHGRTLDG